MSYKEDNILVSILLPFVRLCLSVPPVARLADRFLKLFPALHLKLFLIASANEISAHRALRPDEIEPGQDHHALPDISDENLTRRGRAIATDIHARMLPKAE